MIAEQMIVEFVRGVRLTDIPSTAVEVIRNQVLAVLGTTIAGACEEGCETVVTMAKELEGKPEASILIHGGKAPAQHAAFANGVMARAIDFCDALAPGAHIGAAAITAALATAELVGGCSGADFVAAIAAGTEVAVRLNLGESEYDGFDPTGVCVPFASTAAATKIMGLSEKQTCNALALAFNRCGASFQSNVDGALAVRVIQGWVAETGVTCARLASRGITGPANFLEGIYGYFHLFGRDRMTGEKVVSGLGADYELRKLVFKKYPSCGSTQGSTEAILTLMREEGVEAENIDRIEIVVPPYTYKLVGHPFQIGANPKVNAQFSIRYCVANALVRGEAKLAHFEESSVRNSKIVELAKRIEVRPDPAMESRGHTALDMRVTMKNGKELLRKVDFAPGFPEKPLAPEEHQRRFHDCISFAGKPLPKEKSGCILHEIERLERMEDVRGLIPLLTA